MKKRYPVDCDELERLRTEVERYVGFPIRTPDDFSKLSRVIKEKECGNVSATTLKRIWGYIADTGGVYSPGAYSLRSLCSLIGFRDMDQFVASNFQIQSQEFSGKFIECRRLGENVEVELRWQPNRVCRLRHMKDCLFEVTEVNNARLHKGDIVECGCFTMHAPAYFTRVFRTGAMPVSYIAGSANGIVFNILSESEVL